MHLCDRADASATFLNSADFHELIRCYRRTSGDLATARTVGSNPEMTTFLNDIVGRAYAILYRAPRKSFGTAVIQVLATVAQAGRRRKWFILTAALGFAASTVLAFWLMDAVPATHDLFIPPGMMQKNVDAWVKGLPPRSAGESAMMTGFYASNNPLAAISSMATTSVSFGVGGAYALYENGAMMGALAHEMAKAGRLGFLVVSLLPHGVSELQGLFVSAGAGFVLAWALINPGRKRRGAALAEAGSDAIVLLGTSIVMMFIAAPFEGYFSFNPRIPGAVKLVVAALVAGAWATFWIGFGHTEKHAAETTEAEAST
ncbi:MAG: stage II sporulation protein M [Fimbriimonadaceae bacterium]